MAKKLTKIQKKHIIRLMASNLISQASDAVFDECDITEDELNELIKDLYEYGHKLSKKDEPHFFDTGKNIVEYVRRQF